jgi:hypothetical protein
LFPLFTVATYGCNCARTRTLPGIYVYAGAAAVSSTFVGNRFEICGWVGGDEYVLWLRERACSTKRRLLVLSLRVSQNVAKDFRLTETLSVDQSTSLVLELPTRVARLHICIPKIPILKYFGRPWNGKFCYVFWPFGILYGYLVYFCGHLVYFSQFWYVLPRKIW